MSGEAHRCCKERESCHDEGESPLPSDGLGRLLEGLLVVSRLMRHGLVIMECFQRLLWMFGLGSGWRPSELYAFDIWTNKSDSGEGWYDAARACGMLRQLLFPEERVSWVIS
jgi:hypothetical protein